MGRFKTYRPRSNRCEHPAYNPSSKTIDKHHSCVQACTPAGRPTAKAELLSAELSIIATNVITLSLQVIGIFNVYMLAVNIEDRQRLYKYRARYYNNNQAYSRSIDRPNFFVAAARAVIQHDLIIRPIRILYSVSQQTRITLLLHDCSFHARFILHFVVCMVKLNSANDNRYYRDCLINIKESFVKAIYIARVYSRI